MISKKFIFVILMLSLLGLIGPECIVLAEQPETDSDDDFFDMSIEEHMEVEVTTASKKKEQLFDVLAAAYVIISEDIRRSGATNIPDALRMAPGLQVARFNANKWAITSRGFNSEFTDVMLVMIDGRSIYTPHFGGVRRDTHDVMLEDVDRIEVIRGPVGMLWDANAVNGIINIITNDAKEIQDILLAGKIRTEQEGFGTVRYGDKINEDTYFRVYSKYFNQGDSTQVAGDSGDNAWNIFRADSELTLRPNGNYAIS